VCDTCKQCQTLFALIRKCVTSTFYFVVYEVLCEPSVFGFPEVLSYCICEKITVSRNSSHPTFGKVFLFTFRIITLISTMNCNNELTTSVLNIGELHVITH
jgi:hypothetical protein